MHGLHLAHTFMAKYQEKKRRSAQQQQQNCRKRMKIALFTCFKCIGKCCHVTLFRTHSSISVFIFPLIVFCIVSVYLSGTPPNNQIQMFCIDLRCGFVYHKFIINRKILPNALIINGFHGQTKITQLIHAPFGRRFSIFIECRNDFHTSNNHRITNTLFLL